VLKPMKILHFPVRQPGPPPAPSRIAELESLLREYRTRQIRLHEDERRLRRSLERLATLAREMRLGSEGLKRSAARLRTWGRRIGPQAPRP